MGDDKGSSCYVHAVIQLKPGSSNEFVSIMGELAKQMEQEFGVKLAGTYQARDKPDMFVNLWFIPSQEVLERFATQTQDLELVRRLEARIASEQVEVVDSIF